MEYCDSGPCYCTLYTVQHLPQCSNEWQDYLCNTVLKYKYKNLTKFVQNINLARERRMQ